MAEQILYQLKIEGTKTELDRLAAINTQIEVLKTKLKEQAEIDKEIAKQNTVIFEAEKVQIAAKKAASDSTLSDIEKQKQAEKELAAEKEKNAAKAKITDLEKRKLTKEQIEATKIEAKEAQTAYRGVQKEIITRNKAEEQGVQTIEKMRAQLSRLYKELDNTQVGSKRFQEITVEAAKLRGEIGKAEEASGRFQRNVGNYQSAIQDAFAAMGVNVAGLTQNITLARNAIQLTTASTTGLTTATGGLSAALKVVKIALISTGIGAFLVVLGLVINALRKFDPIIDAIEQGMAALGAVFSSFSDTVLSVITGQKSFSEAVNGAGEAMSKAAKAAIEYTKAQQDLDDKIFESTVNQEKYKNQIAELILQSKNRTLSEQERIKLIDEALKIEETAFAERKYIADEELRLAQSQLIAKNNLTDEEAEDLKTLGVAYAISLKERKRVTDEQIEALTAALVKQQQAEGESIAIREKALNRRDQLEDAANEKAKKRAEEQRAIVAEQIKLQQIADQYAIDAINALLKLKEVAAESPEDTLFSLPDEETIEDGTTRTVEIFEERAQRGLEIIQDFQDQTKSVYENDIEALDAAYQRGLISTEQYEQGKLDIRKQYNAQLLEGTANTLNQLAEIFGKESKAGKAAAIAATAISTYQAALEAYKSLAGIPVVGPTLGAAAAGVATAFGLKQIQKIASTKQEELPRFARGGIIGGRPHSQGGTKFVGSDGTRFEAEQGEYIAVVNKKDAGRAALLDAINSTNGASFAPSNKMALGGISIPQPKTEFVPDYDIIIRKTIEAVGDIKVYVAESEITGTQAKVKRIKVSGDL